MLDIAEIVNGRVAQRQSLLGLAHLLEIPKEVVTARRGHFHTLSRALLTGISRLLVLLLDLLFELAWSLGRHVMRLARVADKWMVHPMYGAELRVKRAAVHIEAISDKIQAWADAHTEAFPLEQTGPATVAPVQKGPLPFELIGDICVLIGDALMNLRAALDYTVYVLAYAGNNWTAVQGTQFPIEDDLDNFRGRVTGVHPTTGKGMAQFLRKVPTGAVVKLMTLQPGFDPPCVWTGLLRDLSNPDKHRHLSAVHSRAWSHVRTIPDDEGRPAFAEGHVEVEILFLDTDAEVYDTLLMLHGNVDATVQLFKGAFQPVEGGAI